MTLGAGFGIIFGSNGGKGIGIGSGLGMTLGIVIGAMIVKFNEDGSEQAEEDGELMTDEEEKQVWGDFQDKVEEDDN